MLTINLTDEISQAVEQMAAQQRKSSVELINDAITEMLEDYHDARLAEQAIDDLRAGKDKTISLDELEQSLNELDS
jgi:RHH-type rel operon transcriptional repressor/antitoxin RelB